MTNAPGRAFAACLLLGAVGCGPDIGLDAHRRTWSALAAKNYTYQLRWSCFCPPEITDPAEIQVKSGAVTAVKNVATGQPVAAARFKDYRTIDGLFTFLDESLARGPDEIKVSWDDLIGYPRSAAIDFVKAAADEEQGFTASNFVRMPD